MMTTVVTAAAAATVATTAVHTQGERHHERGGRSGVGRAFEAVRSSPGVEDAGTPSETSGGESGGTVSETSCDSPSSRDTVTRARCAPARATVMTWAPGSSR